MADIALGVVGVVGVALQAASATHEFLSSIRGGPRSVKSLAIHISTLKSVLSILNRRLNGGVWTCDGDEAEYDYRIILLYNAIQACNTAITELDNEVRKYVTFPAGSSVPNWGRNRPWRRVKWALQKGSVVELQQHLFASFGLLHFAIDALNLTPKQLDSRAINNITDNKYLENLRSLACGPFPNNKNDVNVSVDAPNWSEMDDISDVKQVAGVKEPLCPEDDPFTVRIAVLGASQNEVAKFTVVVDSGTNLNLISLTALQHLGVTYSRHALPYGKVYLGSTAHLRILGIVDLRFACVGDKGGCQIRSRFLVINDHDWMLSNTNHFIILSCRWIRQNLPPSAKLAEHKSVHNPAGLASLSGTPWALPLPSGSGIDQRVLLTSVSIVSFAVISSVMLSLNLLTLGRQYLQYCSLSQESW